MSDFFYPVFNTKQLIAHLDKNTDYVIEDNGDDHQASKVKVSRFIHRAIVPLCIEIAIITYNGIFHISFLPGADREDVRAVTEAMAQFKP